MSITSVRTGTTYHGNGLITELNPFTHCPCIDYSVYHNSAICGLPLIEGECKVHTSYQDSLEIIAAQEADRTRQEGYRKARGNRNLMANWTGD